MLPKVEPVLCRFPINIHLCKILFVLFWSEGGGCIMSYQVISRDYYSGIAPTNARGANQASYLTL